MLSSSCVVMHERVCVGLTAFLSEVALMGGDDSTETPQSTTNDNTTGDAKKDASNSNSSSSSNGNSNAAPQDVVRLMTVHGSKGLEFDTVFITGNIKNTPANLSRCMQSLFFIAC